MRANTTKRLASGPAAMSYGGTLAEFKHDCHVAASLGLALMDDGLLARDFVIRKRWCGGLSHAAESVA